MYIEFTLPSNVLGAASRAYIEKALQEWSEKYNIRHNVKIQNFKLKVTFSNPEYYSFWALTWVSTGNGTERWCLVEPMNPPKSRNQKI